ncbi:MAG: DoxX family protein [Gordonia sp. (in: high G+C Gram-positive bacteria)]
MYPIRSLALLVARVLLGGIFIAHGWQKLHTYGHAGVSASFTQMGVPLPGFSAYYATWVEFVGGILLILGAALPLVSVLLIIDMIGAIFTAHIDAGFWATHGGWEFPLALIAGLVAVGFAQAGGLAVDTHLFRRRRS